MARSAVAVPPNSFRKSHDIEGSVAAAQTDYQVKIKALYSDPDPEEVVPDSEILSTLPQPAGTTFTSLQAAIYWDGTNLHVWYGSSTDGTADNDDIYYTKTSDFLNWDVPVLVIDRVDGIRDPTSFIEGDTIYLFCQCYAGADRFRPIRLYKIDKSVDFTNPANYTYVGVPIDVGGGGSYDEYWVASACIVKIGDTYWMAYEALSDGAPPRNFSIGRAKTTNIETMPWTKDGQMRDSGVIIRSPGGATEDIVPDTFPDSDTLFFHYRDAGNVWNVRYLTGDLPGNDMAMSASDIDPPDGETHHVNIAHIGEIGGEYYFLMQTRSDAVRNLRLYWLARWIISLSENCRTDFGDVRFRQGETELDYWMEEKVDSDYAVFWVEVPNIPGSGDVPNYTTIYVYYGMADETTTSSGPNTFLDFDDFDDNILDPSWTVDKDTATETIAEESQQIHFHHRADRYCHLERAMTDDSVVIRVKLKRAVYDEASWALALGVYFNLYDWARIKLWNSGARPQALWCHFDKDEVLTGAGANNLWSADTWMYVRIMLTADTVYFDYSSDGENWINLTSTARPGTWDTPDLVIIGHGYEISAIQYPNADWDNNEVAGAERESYADEYLVRKYVRPEPAHGDWGSEEAVRWPF